MSHTEDEPRDHPDRVWESSLPFGLPTEYLQGAIDWGTTESPVELVSPSVPVELSNQMSDADWASYCREKSEFARASPGRATGIWFVVRVDIRNPEEALEYHERLPMLIPKLGRGDLAYVSSDITQVRAFLDSHVSAEAFLVFRSTLHGELAWKNLLGYLGETGSLDKESDIAT